jgi:hypothetical protein
MKGIHEKYRDMVREVTGRLAKKWSYEVITDPSECEKITAGIERNSKFKALKEALLQRELLAIVYMHVIQRCKHQTTNTSAGMLF